MCWKMTWHKWNLFFAGCQLNQTKTRNTVITAKLPGEGESVILHWNLLSLPIRKDAYCILFVAKCTFDILYNHAVSELTSILSAKIHRNILCIRLLVCKWHIENLLCKTCRVRTATRCNYWGEAYNICWNCFNPNVHHTTNATYVLKDYLGQCLTDTEPTKVNIKTFTQVAFTAG